MCKDFNKIMFAHEKVRGIPKDNRRIDAFRGVLEECHLIFVGYFGVWYTWERGNLPETNIRERLDRAVSSDDWLSMFSNALVKHLPHSFSYHCPLLASTNYDVVRSYPISFRF